MEFIVRFKPMKIGRTKIFFTPSKLKTILIPLCYHMFTPVVLCETIKQVLYLLMCSFPTNVGLCDENSLLLQKAFPWIVGDIYMGIYIYIHTHTYIHIYLGKCIYSVFIYTHICVYVCVCVCMYVYGLP